VRRVSGWDYKRSVDEVLGAPAGLTDEQKASVEFFDDKWLSIGTSVGYAALAHPDLELDGWVHVQFGGSVAIFDALAAAWHWKTKGSQFGDLAYECVQRYIRARSISRAAEDDGHCPVGTAPVRVNGPIGRGARRASVRVR